MEHRRRWAFDSDGNGGGVTETGCVCSVAGYCSRHFREKSEGEWQACQTDPRTFANEERVRPAGGSGVLEPMPCRFRAPIPHAAFECGGCGGSNRKPVHHCGLYGVSCTPLGFIRKSGEDGPTPKVCEDCEGRESDANPFPEPLTVASAVCEEPADLWFTWAAIRSQTGGDRVRLLAVDNRPDSRGGELTKELCKRFGAVYVPFAGAQGTNSPRDLIFRVAETDVVVCLDPHVIVEPGALAAVSRYFANRPGCRDLVSGSLINDQGAAFGQYAAQWSKHHFGTWATDPAGRDAHPGNPPYEIGFSGLGAFAMRPAAWPGMNAAFRGFGGAEGYLHEKTRRAGGASVCLPAFRWRHLFARFGRRVAYTSPMSDRVRNYLIGWAELGLPVAGIVETFQHVLSNDSELQRLADSARMAENSGGPNGLF